MMKKLSCNKDLYEYMILLVSILQQRDLISLSKIVEFASRLASTIPDTEFLGESRLAIKQVLEQDKGVLTDEERADLCDVLRQLNEAFNRR